MTYEELVEKARQTYGRADASGIKEHIAYQFNITGEAEGAFYLEVSDGQVKIEPYEYFDRDVLFTTTAETLIKIGIGVLDPVWAYTTGKLKVQGSLDKALLLKQLSIPEESAEEAAEDDAGNAEEAAEGTENVTETEETDAEEEKEEAADSAADAEEAAEDDAEKENVSEKSEVQEAGNPGQAKSKGGKNWPAKGKKKNRK